TSTLFPYTTLFRSGRLRRLRARGSALAAARACARSRLAAADRDPAHRRRPGGAAAGARAPSRRRARARSHARACRPDVREEPRRARRRRPQDHRCAPAGFRPGGPGYRDRQVVGPLGSEKCHGNRRVAGVGPGERRVRGVLSTRGARRPRLFSRGAGAPATRDRVRLAQRVGSDGALARAARVRQHRAGGERHRPGQRRQRKAAPPAGVRDRLRHRLPHGLRCLRRAGAPGARGRQLARAHRARARGEVDRGPRHAARNRVSRPAERPARGRAERALRRDGRPRRQPPVPEAGAVPFRNAALLQPSAGPARLPSATMDFQLTSEQEQFRNSVLAFSKKHLAAGARERAHAAQYPWDVARLMAQQGLLGITLPEADGGQGGSLMDAVIAIETVASVCPRSADVVQAGNFGPIRVLGEYGSEAQKNRFLTRLLSGEAVISVGMTEPEAGSAVTDLKTSATPDGDGYRINGSKVFTTHSAYADVIL